MANNIKTVIEGRITALAASEKVTKAELGAISRELLIYVPDTKDIGMVNRLLDVLTPMNRKTAGLFFKAFLPWKFDDVAFSTMIKGEKAINNKLSAITTFLKNEENNIWTWAAENITIEAKPKNYAVKIAKLVEKAIGDKEEGIDTKAVLGAVMAGGVSAMDVINLVESMKAELEAVAESDEQVPVIEEA